MLIRRVRIGLAVAAALIGFLAGYELLVGFPRFTDGKWARRVTIWHAYSMALPIPYQRGTVCYAYMGTDGMEGSARALPDAARERPGQHRRCLSPRQAARHLDYHNEQIHEGDRLVAWKRYENGRWFLAVPVGVEPRFRIDPATGALERVTP